MRTIGPRFISPRAIEFLTAVMLMSSASLALAYPGKVIIGSGFESYEIVDEGYLYVDDLTELEMKDVASVSLHIKVVSDQGRIHEAQIADGYACEVEFDAAGRLEAVECVLDDN